LSFKDITLGRYLHGDSIIHNLDPRTKLIGMFAMMSAIFIGKGVISLSAAVIFTITAIMLSELSILYILKTLLPFKWLLIITFMLNILFVGGQILIDAPLPYGGITVEGLATGTSYTLKLTLLIVLASVMTLTTQPISLVAALETFFKPFKRFGVRPGEIATAMVITLRFIPVFIDEAVKIRKSHIARGLNPKSGLREKIKSAYIMLLPLFVSAVRRAEELAVSMECRLYTGDSGRTRYHEIIMKKADYFALIIVIFVSTVIAFI
jgi:energy-coupling factor transport system permease protein